MHVRDTEVRARISYAGVEQPCRRARIPKDVFSALFGGAAAAGTGDDRPGARAAVGAAQERLRPEQRRDRAAEGAGGRERHDKLDAHLTAMRDVETAPGRDGRQRRRPAAHRRALHEADDRPDVDLKNDDQYLKAGQMQMDLAAAALACDQTRILTFQWSYSESEHLFQFLNISGNHHAISHDFSSSGDELRRVQHDPDLVRAAVRATSSASWTRTRKATGTLLDNSIVLWATEIGESTQHDLTLMPYVLAGSAGGKIRAGRFIDYGTPARTTTSCWCRSARPWAPAI